MENLSENTNNITEKTLPPMWHCDIYCRKIRHVDCEGKSHIDANAPELCPYFDEMLY